MYSQHSQVALPTITEGRVVIAADALRDSAAPSQYRFGVTIPSKFFEEIEHILSRLKPAPDLLGRAKGYLVVVKKKNDKGFPSNDAVTAELNKLLHDMQGVFGSENELVRFILSAFAQMMDDVIL